MIRNVILTVEDDDLEPLIDILTGAEEECILEHPFSVEIIEEGWVLSSNSRTLEKADD